MFWLYLAASLATVALVLALLHRPLGRYIAWVFTSDRDWGPERAIYRVIGVDPRAGQTWQSYLRAVLFFSAAGLLVLYALQRLQQWLPYAGGHGPVSPAIAFNTAISFVTNTNWQAYAGEQTLGYTVQFAGLAVQNVVSAATGLAVAIGLVRGFAYRKQSTIGNFWVDLTRGTVRIMLPFCLVGAMILIAGGVIQNLADPTVVTTLTGGTQSLPGGPVASQEVAKLLGTNGGGFFNANSAHPYENPTPWTNLFQIILILLIPVTLPGVFGRLVGDRRQGRAILAAMSAIFVASVVGLAALESRARGLAPQLAGAALEGKEQRFGLVGSVLFASTTTLTSTGAVNSAMDSYTALGSATLLLNMLLGEVAPGGVGSGLYGMLILAVVTVFIAGLLVGRTPEFLGKKIGPREIKQASLSILVMPILVLAGLALTFAIPEVRAGAESALTNTGPHGLSEVLYAFASAANNNGSAFAGLDAGGTWFAVSLGVAMLLGRFLPIVFALALAGSLAEQDAVPPTAGTLPTHGPLFVVLLIGITFVVAGLVFFPVLTLGPLAEGLI